MKNIGLIGPGVMGAGIAANLLKNGFALTVYARTPAKVQALFDAGARQAATVADAVKGQDAVILSAPKTEDVEAMLFGAGGIASALDKGAVVIDTSTISATATREFAQRLAAQGNTLLDAPISGGQKGAIDGTLTCMVGGTQEAFDRCLPVLQGFAKTITLIGDSGAGQVCKACNQINVIASMLAACEMVALCKKCGIDPAKVRSALLGGSAKSAVLENHTLRVINETFTPGFRADLLLKDLRLALELEQSQGIFAPMTSAAQPIFEDMVAQGMGDLDWSAVALLVQERSGLPKARA